MLLGLCSINAQEQRQLSSEQQQLSPNSNEFILTETTRQTIEVTGYGRCLTEENEAALQQQYPNRSSSEEFEQWLAPKIAEIKAEIAAGRAPQVVYNIPVVVHVVHNGDPVNTPGNIVGENISDAQVISQINVMNQDYRRMVGTPGGANTTGAAVDVEINFCLAQTDPNGLLTSGIVRHNIAPYSNNVADGAGGPDWETRADVEAMKTVTQWDPTKYLNMWAFRPGGLSLQNGGLQGLLGYAQFPDNTPGLGGLSASGGAANTDGVTAGFDAFGSIAEDDGSFSMNATYNLGRTMTHEVGHWLGLRHIWGDGPQTGSCGVDDFCNDTPNAAQPNYNCVANNSCAGSPTDMIQNYMDYTNDACMDTFTADQKIRMQAVMAQSPRRMELNTSTRCQAPAPFIEFASTSATLQETTDCGFTDHNIEVTIGKAPSANATITFNITGGTGTNNTDFEIVNNPITFPSGSDASQNLVVRVYNDGFVEGNETIDISMGLATSGDAVLNTGTDAITITLTDDDALPNASSTTNLQAYDFEDATGLGIIDSDGDGENFTLITGAFSGVAGQWIGSIVNPAVIGGSGALLNPDNYLTFPQITIPADATNVDFTFEVGTNAAGGEHYAVYFAADTSTPANILAGTLLEDRTSIGGATETHTVSTAALAGLTGSFVLRHFNQVSNTLLIFDTLSIVATSTTGVQTALNSGTPDQNGLTSAGTIYTANNADGNVMVDIANNNGVNYGCVDTFVSRAYNAGTPAMQYQGASVANYVMSKTFDIAPATTNASGNATLKFYFTEAEIAAWETATGNSRNDLIVIKDNGASESSGATLGAFGPNVTLEASFLTGIAGKYYFGTTSTLSVVENQFDLFSALPNPTSDILNISLSSDDNVKVSLYDIRGRLVYNELFNNNSTTFNRQIDFSEVASGIYMLNVESGAKKATKKIVIQ